MNRVILHGFVITEPVRVPDADRIRFAFRVPRPPQLPRKRSEYGNADHVLVETKACEVKIDVGQAFFCEGRLESRDSREARTVVTAERLIPLDAAPGLNVAWIGGFLTDDALLFTTHSGRPKLVCRLAVVRPRSLRRTGAEVDFVSVEMYGPEALTLLRHLGRGTRVVAHGYLQSKDERGDPDTGWPISVVATEMVPAGAPRRRDELQNEESLEEMVNRFLQSVAREEQA